MNVDNNVYYYKHPDGIIHHGIRGDSIVVYSRIHKIAEAKREKGRNRKALRCKRPFHAPLCCHKAETCIRLSVPFLG